MENGFWNALKALVVHSDKVIDRPRGSSHPRYADMLYPLDYGYLAGTTSGDGQGIDIWVGSLMTNDISGIVCTVDRYKRDSEIKICLGCTVQDLQTIVSFYETHSLACLLIEYRPQAS